MTEPGPIPPDPATDPGTGGRMPLVVALDMGYGHLRAAHALAGALGTEVMLADRPPLAEGEELLLWAASRRFYETVSRLSQLPLSADRCAHCSTRSPTSRRSTRRGTSRRPTSSAAPSSGGWRRGSAGGWRSGWRDRASRS